MNPELILALLAALLALVAAIGAWRPRPDLDASTRKVEDAIGRSRAELQQFHLNQQLPLREELRLGRLDQGARLESLQDRIQERLERISSLNEVKLEEMRRTVDERLQATLEQRLGESFRLVGERLEQVQRGLGEMQALAQDVGGLKRALTNVKSRGVLGEAQLGALLEQYLASGQYSANVKVKPRSQEIVEFAVKLPGVQEGETVWLPIDAKFPIEDFLRLGEAYEEGDRAAVEQAGKALEQRVLAQGREIRDRYIAPPHTTDFALLFLPFEGLYAEVLRRPGLLERLQRECRVTIVGPTTLTAFLNSLQVGFRTLAITKRSSEVWKLLGGVKAEFGKFGEALQALDRKLDEAKSRLGNVTERTRILGEKLTRVESEPAQDSSECLSEVPKIEFSPSIEG
jgi:DNA recombination protein RmuC